MVFSFPALVAVALGGAWGLPRAGFLSVQTSALLGAERAHFATFAVNFLGSFIAGVAVGILLNASFANGTPAFARSAGGTCGRLSWRIYHLFGFLFRCFQARRTRRARVGGALCYRQRCLCDYRRRLGGLAGAGGFVSVVVSTTTEQIVTADEADTPPRSLAQTANQRTPAIVDSKAFASWANSG